MILFYHFAVRYPELYNVNSILKNVNLNFLALIGVSGFFIISGYFINSNKELSNREKVFLYLKRILNLWLVYCVAIIIIYIFSLSGKLGADRSPSFLDLIKNIFLVNFFGGKYIDGAHWYVVSLIVINIYFLILSLLKINNKKIVYYIYLLIAIIVTTMNNTNMSNMFIVKILNKVLFCQYLPQIIIGISMSNIIKNNKIDLKWSTLIILSIINMCIINISYLVILPLLIVSIYFILKERVKFLEKSRFLVMVGDASFSIYLLHQYIGYMLLNSLNINYYFSLIIVIIVTIIMGLIFYYFIEKNIKKSVNYLFLNLSKKF